MTERYYVVKAENGYYVSVECEGVARDVIFEDECDLHEFMTKTLMAELKEKGKVNVYTMANEFVENKLEGLKATLEHVVCAKQRLREAMLDIEQVEKEIEIMVGNPLTLSYGYVQNLNNGEGILTEIVMSRRCSLAEAIWALVHMYGVDRECIRLKNDMFGNDMNSNVEHIEKWSSWGKVEYIIFV